VRPRIVPLGAGVRGDARRTRAGNKSKTPNLKLPGNKLITKILKTFKE